MTKKPHVLFVTEKWCGFNPEHGETNSMHNLFGSLESTGLATFENIFYDSWFYDTGNSADNLILHRAGYADIVIATVYKVGKKKKDMVPNVEKTLSQIKCPVVIVHFDYTGPKNRMWASSITRYIGLNVVLDTYKTDTRRPKKCIALWTPQDPRLFYDAGYERDIDISFVGTKQKRLDRSMGLQALQDANINVHITGGQREDRIDPWLYAEIMQRSKIVLNWCDNRGKIQLKGRVFEATLCGAMLMESYNDEVVRYFNPYKEFVPFDSTNPKDLVSKVREYLENEDKRLTVARAGYEKAVDNYTAEKWWRAVFARCGLEVAA